MPMVLRMSFALQIFVAALNFVDSALRQSPIAMEIAERTLPFSRVGWIAPERSATRKLSTWPRSRHLG